MKYKITAISAHYRPQEFFAETKEEAKEIRNELRDQQYLVEIEEIPCGE